MIPPAPISISSQCAPKQSRRFMRGISKIDNMIYRAVCSAPTNACFFPEGWRIPSLKDGEFHHQSFRSLFVWGTW
jgi:hypothetical protein